MGNEKYVNYYIEVLTTTLNDCVIRNVSMQANAKITDDVIKEQTEKIEKLSDVIRQNEEVIKKLTENKTADENNIINDFKNKVAERDADLARLTNQLAELNNKYRDYDSIKNQATHTDTFKGELIKAREEILRTRNENKSVIDDLTKKHEEEKLELKKQLDELTAKIEYLQLTPARRKKIDELNKGASPLPVVEETPTVSEDENATQDGGSF